MVKEFSIERISEEKPFKHIIQNLENTFSKPKQRKKSDPLSMLIKIILSQATSDANSAHTFENLRKRFGGNWETVLAAEKIAIADAIRLGGLASQNN